MRRPTTRRPSRGEVRQRPPAAVAKIRANAKRTDGVLAVVSTWALVKLQPADETVKKEAAETLAKALTSADRAERIAAAKAIVELKLGYEFMKPAFAKVREGASEETIADALRAFAALGEPAVPELIQFLKFEKPRAGVAFILGEMGPQAKGAVDALTGLLERRQGRSPPRGRDARWARSAPLPRRAVPALVKHIDDADNAAGLRAPSMPWAVWGRRQAKRSRRSSRHWRARTSRRGSSPPGRWAKSTRKTRTSRRRSYRC